LGYDVNPDMTPTHLFRSKLKPRNNFFVAKTGPRVFVVQNSKSSKLHITGGYGQSEMKKTLCGQKVKTPTVFDSRDTAARDGYQDHTKWCVKCMGLLDFEALDQIILFAAIEWPTGTNGQHSVVPHLSRKKLN